MPPSPSTPPTARNCPSHARTSALVFALLPAILAFLPVSAERASRARVGTVRPTTGGGQRLVRSGSGRAQVELPGFRGVPASELTAASEPPAASPMHASLPPRTPSVRRQSTVSSPVLSSWSAVARRPLAPTTGRGPPRI